MNKFRVGDVVRLTSEAREDYRKTFNIAGDEDHARTFVEMVKKGTKATVSSVDTEGVWLENNQFWIPQDAAVLACQAVAIETHSTLEGTSVEVKHKVEHNPVTKPKHYQLLPGIEVIDVLDALCKKIEDTEVVYFNPAEASYYTQAVGYLMRSMDKNGIEDLKKASWYIDRLIKSMEERNERKG